MPGLVIGRERGGLLLGLEDGLYAFDADHGLGDRLIAVEADDPRTRLNDGKPDRNGRLWFGTMDKTGTGEPIGALYRLDHDGRVTRIRSEVRIPNAICFSLDGTTVYFSDSRSGVLEASPYDPRPARQVPGVLSCVTATARIPMVPASIAMAASGSPWSAARGSNVGDPAVTWSHRRTTCVPAPPCRCLAATTGERCS